MVIFPSSSSCNNTALNVSALGLFRAVIQKLCLGVWSGLCDEDVAALLRLFHPTIGPKVLDVYGLTGKLAIAVDTIARHIRANVDVAKIWKARVAWQIGRAHV